FLPASHPMLDRIGLLHPMAAMGLVPPDRAEAAEGYSPPATPVVAAAAERQVLRDVITAIGSARGVQSVALAPGVSGRLLALKAVPGDRVQAGDLIAELDAEAAQLAVERA